MPEESAGKRIVWFAIALLFSVPVFLAVRSQQREPEEPEAVTPAPEPNPMLGIVFDEAMDPASFVNHEADLEGGATLTVSLRTPTGRIPSDVIVIATKLDADKTTVSNDLVKGKKPARIELDGLAEGTYRVVVRHMKSGEKPYFEGDITSDGSTPIALDLDLP